MYFESTLKPIRAVACDLFKHLDHVYGDTSLEKWLKLGFGDAMYKCLSSATIDVFTAVKCSIILDSIIPPMPSFIEDDFRMSSSEICSRHSSNQESIHELTSVIMGPLSTLVVNNSFSRFSMCRAFFKTIYHATESSIGYDVYETLFNFIQCSLDPGCHYRSHICMALLIILCGKMSDDSLQRFLNDEILFKLRYLISRSGNEKDCPYVEHVRKLCEDLNIEKKLHENVSTWNPLFLTQGMLQEYSIAKDLRAMSQAIDNNKMSVPQFIQNEVLNRLQLLLFNPSEICERTFVIKSFLTVFLEYVDVGDKQYTWRNHAYKNLVILTVKSLEYLVSVLYRILNGYDEVHCLEVPSKIVKLFEMDIAVTLNLLQSLYVLNTTWHQWFHMLKNSKIIDDTSFRSSIFNSYLDSEMKYKTKRMLWFSELTKLCPAVIKFESREEIFRRAFPRERECKKFEILRNDVLRSVFEIFQQNGHLMHSHSWDFTFKDEIGMGDEVTKEVYSILSKELRRHYVYLWRGDLETRTDDEMICNYSPGDLVAKFCKFELLGQIMAKAILDGHKFDISPNEVFFHRLRKTKHLHLRMEHFDLPHAFPMLESLFKDLLQVKRHIEVIRSLPNLTEKHKQEMITNFRFTDGSSFDDLYLNFTVPGTNIELIEGGRDVALSVHNIDLYLEKLHAYKVQYDPTTHQFAIIREAFDKVLKFEAMDMFLPHEIHEKICNPFKKWSVEELRRICSYVQSQSVEYLFECLASLDAEEQKLFLKFTTNRTVGGLDELHPRLSIIRFHRDNPDSSLPNSTSCCNKFFLPDYTSLEVTKKKVLYAIHEDSMEILFI